MGVIISVLIARFLWRGVFSRSDSIKNIVQNAKLISDKGIKEIVLTGVNIGDFGQEKVGRSSTFLDLISALDEVSGISRIRISSIEPNLLSDSNY